jgi:hypothetical protein
MSKPTERAFDHILILMFENQYRSYMMQNKYLRNLAAQGINMLNYFGVMHPSQTNYITSISGELCNVSYDDQPPPLAQRTIVDLIEESPYNLRWRAYMESYIKQNTPWTPELVPKDEYPYVIKHNPFSSFSNIISNHKRWELITDESQFWKDLLNGSFPEYAWFTPNMWNDGHYLDGTQQEPDARAPALVDQLAKWLESFFGTLRFPGPYSHLPANTLVVVTTDEADFEAAFDAGDKYTYDGPNQIYTVLLGDGIQPGVEEEGYNHYSLLKTIEKNFGLASLGKNDAGANWFQFLWGKRFAWGEGRETPLQTAGKLAARFYQGALYVVYEGEKRNLCWRTLSGKSWSGEQEIGQKICGGELALAVCGNELILVYQADSSTPIVSAPVEAIAMTSDQQEQNLMLAYRDADNQIQSLSCTAGVWQSEPVAVGQASDGSITLGTLGASLYLIYKVSGSDELNAVSYNTADFNVVTVAAGQYSGPYDNTTKSLWSPSAFPVAHFSHQANAVTPDEQEPITRVYQAGSPLVTATLDGVLHLAHPGVANSLVLSEEFSISGILTAEKPVSYNQSDETTTSNGYGTLAEAGWSQQRPLQGIFNYLGGAMTLACAETEIVLLFQTDAYGHISLCAGKYE